MLSPLPLPPVLLLVLLHLLACPPPVASAIPYVFPAGVRQSHSPASMDDSGTRVLEITHPLPRTILPYGQTWVDVQFHTLCNGQGNAMNDSPIQWTIWVDAVYQVTLSIERAWQSCFQPVSHRVTGLRQGDRTITVTVFDMVATTQIHVLGLDIYGYGYDMNTTLAIRKSCSTSDVGLAPNASEVAASDVGDDPAVKTFSQNVQKVQDDITALKTELAGAKAGMADAAAAEDKAMFRSDVMRINTELERLGRKEELLLQLMLEKMKQVKDAKDAALRAADKAVQSEQTAADLNDRLLGELRHSDIDTLVCWRAWSAAMPLVTGTGGGAGRKSVSFWTCNCQREIIDYPSTTCKCVRDCPYVSDRFRGWAPTKTCNEGSQIVTVKHSTLWQHPKYFFHKAPPRPINVTETEKLTVKTVKKSWGQINPDAADLTAGATVRAPTMEDTGTVLPKTGSGKTSWTFPHDIAQWEGLGSKITPQALRDIDGHLRFYSPIACSHTGGHMVANSGPYTTLLRNKGGRTGPEACNSSDADANGLGTKWCGAVSRDVLLALTLPNHYSLLAVLASMLPVGSTVVEIGTFYAAGAVALRAGLDKKCKDKGLSPAWSSYEKPAFTLDCGSQVVTYDTVDHLNVTARDCGVDRVKYFQRAAGIEFVVGDVMTLSNQSHANALVEATNASTAEGLLPTRQGVWRSSNSSTKGFRDVRIDLQALCKAKLVYIDASKQVLHNRVSHPGVYDFADNHDGSAQEAMLRHLASPECKYTGVAVMNAIHSNDDMERIWAAVPDAVKFDAGSLGPDGTGVGVIDFKLWPVEDWKACGAYRCFNK